MVERQLYDWLMEHEHTSEENAHILASLLQRSGIQVPIYMRRDGELVNFFLDRSNIFGVVDYVVDSPDIQHPRIYAREPGKSYRHPPRGRGGLHTYQTRRDAQAAADAHAQAAADERFSRFQEYFADNAALEETERQRTSPWGTGYNWNHKLGGKSKSKSRSRSVRKSRNKKNRNRRSKSKSRK